MAKSTRRYKYAGMLKHSSNGKGTLCFTLDNRATVYVATSVCSKTLAAILAQMLYLRAAPLSLSSVMPSRTELRQRAFCLPAHSHALSIVGLYFANNSKYRFPARIPPKYTTDLELIFLSFASDLETCQR